MTSLDKLAGYPRIEVRNGGCIGERGGCVVYRMRRTQRAVDNPALETPIAAANLLEQPVIVFFGLLADHPLRNLRHYSFMIEGLAETAQKPAQRRIGFVARFCSGASSDREFGRFCAEVRPARATAIGVGRAEVVEVDQLNVYWAAMVARRRAVEALAVRPGHILVDGKHRIAGCRLSQTPVVEGDARSATIAAASIVAKVTRDAIMREYGANYPVYGFERHKGYGTAEHLAMLARFGPTPLHRCSFAPVALIERRQLGLALDTLGHAAK